MAVRSEPTRDGQRIEKHPPPLPAIPIAAIIVGLFLWPLGARYTIDGVIWLGNWLLAFLKMPAELPAPTYATYLVLAPLPFIASFVEWRPLKWRWEQELRNPYGVVVWLVVVVLDGISTYAGIRAPDPGAAPWMQELAQSLVLSGILATVLTFGPEWLIRQGWRRLWR